MLGELNEDQIAVQVIEGQAKFVPTNESQMWPLAVLDTNMPTVTMLVPMRTYSLGSIKGKLTKNKDKGISSYLEFKDMATLSNRVVEIIAHESRPADEEGGPDKLALYVRAPIVGGKVIDDTEQVWPPI